MMEHNLPGDTSPENGARDSARDSFEPGPTDQGQNDASGLGFGAGVENREGASTQRKKRPRRRRKSAAGATQARDAGSDDTRAGAATDADPDGPPARATRKAKTARKPRRRSTAARTEAVDDASPEGDEGPPRAPRKKRSRRSSSRKRSGSGRGSDEERAETPADAPAKEATQGEPGTGADSGAAESTDEVGTKKRRRRGSRGGRRRKKATASEAVVVEAIPGEDDDLPAAPERPARKKAKSRSRKKRTRGGSAAEADDTDEGGEADESGDGRRKTKTRASKARTRATVKKPAEVVADQLILVNAIDREEKRVAVVESTRIVDFLMTVETQQTLVNDIYRGRIVNMEPAIGAAFVDFGQGRNGFLHTSDVLSVYGEKDFKLSKLWTSPIDEDEWEGSSAAEEDDVDDDEDDDAKPQGNKKKRSSHRRSRKREPISDLLSNGDQVVVQVTKDAIGDKGPTLTTYISMPGRYLVLMPSMERTGVSRKIPDDRERRRLKRILSSMDLPANMGVIVRTAGVGKTKAELQRDLDYLMGLWETFGKRLNSGRGPMPLYQESEVGIRTMRDLFSTRTEAVIVDDPMVHEQLVEFAEKLMPEQVDRIKLHDGDRPIFHHYGVEQDFEKILSRRVELPSGGSIVFDQTEALVAIDVNSGRTRTDGFDFEKVALKTNLEAAPEIARQIRLRDLGGILVCDFIDMTRTSSMRTVERALRTGLADDRARSKLGRISQFGLLELTRQRLGPGLQKKVFQVCPRCRGTSRVRSVPSRAAGILRRLGSALTQKGFATIEVRAHPEVVDYLDDELVDYLRALEHRFDRKVTLTAVPDQPEDSVLRYLRSDGREVRPGGRRKR